MLDLVVFLSDPTDMVIVVLRHRVWESQMDLGPVQSQRPLRLRTGISGQPEAHISTQLAFLLCSGMDKPLRESAGKL